MTERIIEERPDSFRACATCPHASKAIEEARKNLEDDFRGEEEIVTATIKVECRGGNLSKGILGVHPEIDGEFKNGGGFRTFLSGENAECPGVKEEWITLEKSA